MILFLVLTIRSFLLIIRKLSGCGEVWYRAWFGTKRPRVRIPTLRPKIRRSYERRIFYYFLRLFPILMYGNILSARNCLQTPRLSLTMNCDISCLPIKIILCGVAAVLTTALKIGKFPPELVDLPLRWNLLMMRNRAGASLRMFPPCLQERHGYSAAHV